MSTAVTPPTVHLARGGRGTHRLTLDHDARSEFLLVSYDEEPLELS